MTSGFALANVGPGPDPLSLSELEAEFAVLLLHRDFYCSECRQQVRRVKSRYEEFERRDAEVLSVLPEDREKAEEWQKQYHLPFPVVADPEKKLGERFDQPTRYGLLGKLHDIIGRMPATVVLDLRWSDPMETFAHRGDSKTDRPRVDELLSAIDRAAALAADSTPEEREAAAKAAPNSRNPSSRPETKQPTEPTAPDETSAPPETDSAVEPEEPAERDEPAEATEAVKQNEPAEAERPAESPETVERGGATQEPQPADGRATAGDDVQEAEPSPTVEPVHVPERVTLPQGIEITRAGEDDAMPVIRVLHGALLEIDASTVRRAVARGDVLVAEADGWVIGALILEDNHVDAVAVRREYRKQGIGRALVETAVEEVGGPVTADFRAGVRGFWQDLGFEIEKEGDRFYGIRS